MVFLIEYNRPKGQIEKLQPFGDSELSKAEKLRLELELDLNKRGIAHEVVLLIAPNEEALRVTHRRYFESSDEIGGSMTSSGM